jgi:uncharacterized protein YdeI (YjbR/CyaY-like superfamily)
MTSAPPRFFASAADFRAWLEEHSDLASELLVGFWKVDSGRPSMTWPESVDEALCFGWIDAVRKRIDEHAYQIRFTRRKAGSIWSAVNMANVERLRASARMTEAGERAYSFRTEKRSVVYAYEQVAHAELTAEETRKFRKVKAAWSFFAACPPGYRKTLLHWVTSARKPETREQRLDKLVLACSEGRRLR